MKRTVIAGLWLCCLGLHGQALAQGQTQTKTAPLVYAVMSLIGDTLTIVNYGAAQTGNRIDQNRRIEIAISENALDASALNAIAPALRARQPDAALDVLETRNATLRKLQDKIFANDDAGKGARESLKALLKEHNASRFILITKHKAEAQIQMSNSVVGSGSLEGLGFYIDGSMRLTNSSTLESGYGLIAGYVYATAWLVDAKTMAVLKELPIIKTRAMMKTGSRDNEVSSWDALSEVQRVRFIQSMIRDSMSEAIPKLLSPT